MKRITSAENSLVKELVRLSGSSRERRQAGMAVLDGPHLVAAYAKSGRIMESLIASDTGLHNLELRELFERSPARERIVLSDRLFQQVAPVATPVGLMACVKVPSAPPPLASLGDCVLLEGIQDPGNAGSILRSAAAAGIRQVLVSVGSVFMWSPKVLRAGMGAHFELDVFEHQSLTEAVSRAKGLVIATAGAGEHSLFELDLRSPVAWIFGNEGAGVPAELAKRATYRVRIPMQGGQESLNVAAAAAVCLFEQVRQRIAGAARKFAARA